MTKPEHRVAGERIYRHSIAARATHWLWALAMLVLVMSGLQIFNAAPYLDASDKSNPGAPRPRVQRHDRSPTAGRSA